jgi:hypothetical protein
MAREERFDPVCAFIDHYRAARYWRRAGVSLLRGVRDLAEANRGMLPFFRLTGMKISLRDADGHRGILRVHLVWAVLVFL